MSIFSPPADETEKPLDPALLRVQARLRRLILIAGLTLGLGVAALLVAVVYRIFAAAPAIPPTINVAAPSVGTVATARLTLSDMGLPADARLTATGSNGTRVTLTYAHSGGTTLIFLDERRLAVVGRLDLPAGP